MTFDKSALVNFENSMAAPYILVLNLSHLALTEVTSLKAARGLCYPITHGGKWERSKENTLIIGLE